LLLLLVFGFFMFRAGYQWREWPGRTDEGGTANAGPVFRRDDRVRDGMVGKL
jgi:hypothetical protein